MGKITRFPGSKERRARLNLNARRVPCQVSERWLQFPEHASALCDGTYIALDVMTLDQNEKQRKLCELVLLKEDLLVMLNRLRVEK